MTTQVDWPKCKPVVDETGQLEARVSSLLGRMSLQQKVGQIIQPDIRYISPALAAEYYIGSVLSGGGAPPHENRYASLDDWVKLADEYHKASLESGAVVPILWGVDAVHGHNNLFGATFFPHNIGIGATRNPELVRRMAEATAVELAASGIKWTFAPTLAVARDDRWGRTYESYSEDPALVRTYAGPNIEGYQGRLDARGFLGEQGVLATAKHFLGDGGTEGGIDQGNTVCDEETLFRVHGQAYVDALNAGAQVVMASFSSWNGVKLHGHQYLLDDVLKKQMGFDGFIISDWNGHGQLPGADNEYGVVALKAGIDMIMAPEDWRQLWHNTLDHVNDGLIPLARLDDAVRRILRVKLRAGITFERLPSKQPMAGRQELLASEAHRELARQAVRESLVLLKNQNSLLPLDRKGQILVAGPGADNIPMQCGGWSLTWQGDHTDNDDFPQGTSFIQGVRSLVEGAGGHVATVDDVGDLNESSLQHLDAAIVVFGEHSYAEGHGDRVHLGYSSLQPEGLVLLKKLREAGVPVVSVFLTGRPLWINPELNLSDAFVVAWLPGTEGGVIAEPIFSEGQHDFTGKLPFSWPMDPLQTCLVDTPELVPLYEFGYGLALADDDATPLDLSIVDPTLDIHHNNGLSVFSRKPVSPFQLFVGDEEDWKTPVKGTVFQSKSGTVEVRTVDWQTQEDARKLCWQGNGGQVFLSTDDGVDSSRYFESGAYLVFSACLHKTPERLVKLRLDSHFPAGDELDVTGILGNLPPGVWQTVRIPLTGLATPPFNPSALTTPFLIWTDGEFELSVAEISVEL